MNKIASAFSNLVSLLLASLLSACATDYVGPAPNLNLRGSAAMREYHQYLLVDEDGLFGRPASLTMGPEKKTYSLTSMHPLVEQVSPVGMAELDRAIKWRRTEILSFVATLASIVIASTTTDNGTRNLTTMTAAGGALLTYWGASNVSGAVRSTTKEYNEEIRRKLAPRLEARWDF